MVTPAPSRAPWIVVAILVALAAGGAVFWQLHGKGSPTSKGKTVDVNRQTVVTPAKAETFATYKPVAVTVSPKVAPYTVAADLANINNLNQFTIGANSRRLLAENNFIIRQGWGDEFFSVYESNRYAYVPNFVTTDSMLHTYHLVFDYLLKSTEEQKLAATLDRLSQRMLSLSQAQLAAAKGTSWENAATRNVAFFIVAQRLLDSKSSIPDVVKTPVTQELALIDAHEQIADSPIINLSEPEGVKIETPQGLLTLGAFQEDYSQYVPRGHYTKSDLLSRYFKAMMWYGRLTFRIKSPDEVKSAALMTLALSDAQAQQDWQAIYEPTNFFVGKSDDITY